MKHKLKKHYDALDNAATQLAPAVKAACGCTPQAATRERLHLAAVAALPQVRRRHLWQQLRPLLMSAAVLAILIGGGLWLRPLTPAAVTPPLSPTATLDNILWLATSLDETADQYEADMEMDNKAESLALRLLEIQGLYNNESVILLSYL